MAKSANIHVRIDPDTKTRTEELFSSFGITTSDAIIMFLRKSLMVGGLPFDVVHPRNTEAMSLFVDSSTTSTMTEPTAAPHFSESEIRARVEGLKRIDTALELAKDEDLSDFPTQGIMKTSYDDWAD